MPNKLKLTKMASFRAPRRPRLKQLPSPMSDSVTSVSTSSTNASARAPTLSQQQVQNLGQALQLSIELQNRKCKKTRKKFKQVFLGEEAVEIFQQLAGVGSRQEALQVGRLVQHSSSTGTPLFHCVNAPKCLQLEDSPLLFYQFDTPKEDTTQPKKKLKIKDIEAKMRVFQNKVVVKDRDYLLTTYKDCFVGNEAVDIMMKYKLGRNRQECVDIGRVFQNQYQLFVPVTSTGFLLEFEDDQNRYYRLSQPRKEEKAPTFLQEVKPARWLIVSCLVPACIGYYYLY